MTFKLVPVQIDPTTYSSSSVRSPRRWPNLYVAVIFLVTLQGCWVNESVSIKEIRERAIKAPYEKPAGMAVLTEAEIYEKIIGNTLVSRFSNDKTEVVEYLRPDGRIKALWNMESSQGFWTVSRSLLCLYYPLSFPDYPPRPVSQFHCFTLTLDDQIVSYYYQNGLAAPVQATLLPGNARDLYFGQ